MAAKGDPPAVDEGLSPFIHVTEVAEGRALAADLFRHRYNDTAPDWGHHILAFYRRPDGAWSPASYVNYLPHDGAMLIGGACTDDRVLAAMTPGEQERVARAGGLMLQNVRYAEARFAGVSVGTFGHCGDARSWTVLERAGFVRLDHPHLVVRWNREPASPERDRLIAGVDALGPF